MRLPTIIYTSRINPPKTPPFPLEYIPPPLSALPLVPVPAPPWGGGYLLQSDDNGEYFKEYEYFNRERDDCAYLYAEEILH